MNMSGFFGNSPWDGGGGGGGTPVIVIDNLQSTSGTEALSANQGRELKVYFDDLNERVQTIESVEIVDASLTEKGLTKLNDDIDSTSIEESATPNAVRKALEEAKKYADEIEEKLKKNKFLRKYEFQVSPSTSGQTVFEIPLEKYNPNDFEELIFLNSTKVPEEFYTITIPSGSTKHVITFNSGINSVSSLINIVLLTEEDEDGNVSLGLEKREFDLKLTQQGQTTIEIPFPEYSPELYVDLLFFNSTKLPPTTYSIVKINESDPNSNYQIVLNDTPINYQSANFNLVLLTNGNERTGGNIPSDTVNKSSIIFGVRGKVQSGRIVEEFFPVSFDMRVIEVIATVVNPSSENLTISIEKTNNFNQYSNILPTNLTISQGLNSTSIPIGYDLILSKGENLFLNIAQYAEDASNLVVSMIIEKI